jgi:hypothetical protein
MLETIYISILVIVIIIFMIYKKQNLNLVQINNVNGLKFSVYKDNSIKDKQQLLTTVINNMLVLKDHLVNNKDKLPEEYK